MKILSHKAIRQKESENVVPCFFYSIQCPLRRTSYLGVCVANHGQSALKSL
ncbi:hypothetical protein LguiA_019838 [Lonicera macranthoides]